MSLLFALLLALSSCTTANPSLLRARMSKSPALPTHRSQDLSAASPAQPVPEHSPAKVTRARLLLLLSGAIYGTYTVFIRALNVVGGEKLPSIFVTFVRYFFLTGMAFALRAWRTRQAQHVAGMTASSAGKQPLDRKLWLCALELAFYTVVSAQLSVWGAARVPAVMAEILLSTVHVFVPIQTLFMVGGSGFGVPTWLGCSIAFGAATISCVADNGAAATGSSGARDVLGQGALVASSFAYGLFRVRTQAHLKAHAPEALNLARMICMGALATLTLVADVILGGGSRAALARIRHVLPMQWVLMFMSVFLSAFIASALAFSALQVIPAANAQPFSALQPLFCALWATLLLSEPISKGAMLGGALMIGATAVACSDRSV